MTKMSTWWFWASYLEAPEKDILLYAALVPNYANYKQNTDLDEGELSTKVGKVVFFSTLLTTSQVDCLISKVSSDSQLDLSTLRPTLSKSFEITSYRDLIGSSFGQRAVPIRSYYTTPSLEVWVDYLDELASVLNFLKRELNLPFDGDYSRKFGNFEVHNLSDNVQSNISIQLLNQGKGGGTNCIRVARKEPLVNENQMLHVICRESKDTIFQKLIELKEGVEVTKTTDIPEDCYEFEYWLFDSSGKLIDQDHQYFIAQVAMNMGIVSRQVSIEDKLSLKAQKVGKELANKASIVRKTNTKPLSIDSRSASKYRDFDETMVNLQPILFPKSGHDVWFGKSIRNEVNVIKHFQRLIDNGAAKKAIIVDPFFGADAFERFVTRIEESTLELIIVTSLGNIDPDSGNVLRSDVNPVDELKKSILKTKEIINCQVKVININWSSTNQAFHDRYLITYSDDPSPLVYMLSNSINKMAGNWPFCITKIEPSTASQIQEYIEGLCIGVDNSRVGNPKITYQWPEIK